MIESSTNNASEIKSKTISIHINENNSISSSIWFQISLVVLTFFIALSSPIFLIMSEWKDSDFSHGIIVPFISLYFIWIERKKIIKVPIKPALFEGIVVILLGAIFLVVGKVGLLSLIEETSVIIIIPGLVLLLLGKLYFKALLLPLGYLIFMVPVLGPLIAKLHWPFQIFTAKFAAAILPYLGIPVYRNIQFLELSNVTLEVAKECSGVNFMQSVYAIAIPLAYLSLNGLTRKVLLMILTFFIGLFTNGIRVTLIGVWTYYNLGNTLHGPYHLLQGYFVSIFGFILLFITSFIMSKISFPEKAQESVKNENLFSYPEVSSEKMGRGGFTGAWVIAMTILLLIGGYINFFNTTPVLIKKPFEQLPVNLREWKSLNLRNDKSLLRIPGADSELTRIYTKGSSGEVMVYIGYINSMEKDKSLFYDLFEDNFSNQTEIDVVGPNGNIRLNKKSFKINNRNYLALYWFDINGKALTNARRAKLETAYNGLFHRSTNGALIIVMSELKTTEFSEEVFKDEISVVTSLKPQLKDHLPQL